MAELNLGQFNSVQLLTISTINTYNYGFDDLCDSVKFKILHHVRRLPKKLHPRPGVSGFKHTTEGKIGLNLPAALYVHTEFKFRKE